MHFFYSARKIFYFKAVNDIISNNNIVYNTNTKQSTVRVRKLRVINKGSKLRVVNN